MSEGDPVSPASKRRPAASSLQGLFEEDQGHPVPPPESAASSLVSAGQYDGRAPWPSGIPDLTGALAILRGEVETPVPLRPQTEAFLRALSSEFRDFLTDTAVELPPELALLARAAAVRWRVAVALSTYRPSTRTDANAIELLFSELDLILTELRDVGADAPDELQADLGAERVALAKAAVDLSEALQSESKQAAHKAVQASAEKYKTLAPTRTGRGASRAMPGWKLVVFVLLVVGALGAGVFFGLPLLNERLHPAPISIPVSTKPAAPAEVKPSPPARPSESPAPDRAPPTK
ncbi:MAG: hypothetical protein ACT4TC_07530 [Myxococcaceae bacterium]